MSEKVEAFLVQSEYGESHQVSSSNKGFGGLTVGGFSKANDFFRNEAGNGASNTADNGLERILLKEIMNPKNSNKENNIFNTKLNLSGSMNNFLKNLLNPLDKLVSPAGTKMTGALGGILTSTGKGQGGTVSESLSNMITNNLNLDTGSYIKALDQKIIAEKLPFMGGALSGSLDQFMAAPDGSDAWENAAQDRITEDIAKDRVNPLALLNAGIPIGSEHQMSFTTEGGRSSWLGATHEVLRSNTNEYGVSSGLTPTNTTLAAASEWGHYFAGVISDNYRTKNERYNELMDLGLNADPLFDKGNRHTIAYSYLQQAKEGGVAFIDGAGDYIQETWNNFGVNARESVSGYINSANQTLQSFGFDAMINPDLQKKLDKVMDKLGFPKKRGDGMDYEGAPTKELIFSNVVVINGVELPPDCFVGYFEDHDYIDSPFPKRTLKVRVPGEQKEKINLKEVSKEKKLTVTLSRFYAFTKSQNYDLFSFNGNATYRPYEVLVNFEGIPDIYEWRKRNSDTTKSANKDTIKEWSTDTEELTITLTSPLEKKMGTAIDLFSGIPNSDASIESILAESFRLHFFGNKEDSQGTTNPGGTSGSVGSGLISAMSAPIASNAGLAINSPTVFLNSTGGASATSASDSASGSNTPAMAGHMQLALTKPEVSKNLNTIIPPKPFPEMVKYFQDETGGKLFNGGYNIFQDHDIVYVLNKKGPNKIEFEHDYKYTFRFLANDTAIDTAYTIISRSEKRFAMGLMIEDVMKLGDMSIYNEEKTITIQSGSSVTLPTPYSGPIGNAVYTNTHTDASIVSPSSIRVAEEFLIRIPNTLALFRPGDNIKLQFPEFGEELNGTVKKWAAEQNLEVRAVLLYLTLKRGKEEGSDSDLENNPINRAIRKIQETTATITNKYESYIDNLQSKLTSAAQQPYNQEAKRQAEEAAQNNQIVEASNFSEALNMAYVSWKK